LNIVDEAEPGFPGSAFFSDPEQRERIMRRLQTGEIVQTHWQQLKRQDGSFFYANVTENILERDGQEVIPGRAGDMIVAARTVVVPPNRS
jgi:hypothetical protein